MPNSRHRFKTPEEIELDLKKAERDRLNSELSVEERSFSLLRNELRIFEQLYAQVLGARITELEALEWQLKGLLGENETVFGEYQSFGAGIGSPDARTDLLDDDPGPLSGGLPKTMKSLYREVAKAIHPDLAPDCEERVRRQELMSIANRAYEEGNRQALQEIMDEWISFQEPVSVADVAGELIKVIRDIARIRQDILVVRQQIEELKGTDTFRLKKRVDDALSDGIDLLAEMAAIVDLDIVKARKRLGALNGEESPDDAGPPLETRIIRFDSHRSNGVLFTRPEGSDDYRQWQRIGDARGIKEIPLGRSLRLDVRGVTDQELSFVSSLAPNDLQALFLYDVNDGALLHIRHLTGLCELYLSNTFVTDEGLKELAPLTGLKRIYIYHTPVSDEGVMNLIPLSGLKWLTCSGTLISPEGIARFRQRLPGCRAVSFKWRYDQV